MNKESTKLNSQSRHGDEPMEILSTLSKVAYHYRRMLSMQSTNYGISPNEGGLLLLLYRFKDITTASQVSKEMGVTKSLISRSVDRLLSNGYIVTKADESDRRVQHLLLTDKALEICEKIYADSSEIYSKAVGGLTDKEMSELKILLNKIAYNFEK